MLSRRARDRVAGCGVITLLNWSGSPRRRVPRRAGRPTHFFTHRLAFLIALLPRAHPLIQDRWPAGEWAGRLTEKRLSCDRGSEPHETVRPLHGGRRCVVP